MELIVSPKVQHKCHIEKIMYLTGVARPRYDENGEVTFNGLVAIVPCVKEAIARRASKNHEKGDAYMVNESIDNEVYRDLFTRINGVFDQMELKMPVKGRVTYVQQDGAGAHRKEGTMRFLEQSGSDNFDVPVEDRVTVTMKTQPSQSPDFNVNDCAFYNSLQCAIQSESTYNTNREDMMRLVEKNFHDFSVEKLDRIWGILFDNLRQGLKSDGGNDYKTLHAGKRKRQKSGGTCVDLTVPMEDYRRCKALVAAYRAIHPLN